MHSQPFRPPFAPPFAPPDLVGPNGKYLPNSAYSNVPRSSADVYAPSIPYFSGRSYLEYPYRDQPAQEQGGSSLLGGTLLHKGFYDLLALIPTTATASRLLWGPARDEPVAGPRYESIAPQPSPTPGAPVQNTVTNGPPRRGRRISKEMVSKPMNFV